MNLTGKQLVEKNIITGAIPEENIQQCGIDLNLIAVQKVEGGGFIPASGKTKLADRVVILPELMDGKSIFILNPGVYDFTFSQGCNTPSDQRLDLIQRSSCSRNGLFIRSAVFDPGFKTDNIGTMVMVMLPIAIEVGARVAQIVAISSNTVDNLYNGQFQGDNQRNSN